MLDRGSRLAIATVAFAAIAALAVAPPRVRSADDPPLAHERRPLGPQPPPLTMDIVRDPFAVPIASPTTASAGRPDPAPGAPADVEPLPSNLASDAIPALPGAAGDDGDSSRVSAVATGPHPYAIIAAGSTHVVVGIGDTVAGEPIVAIGLDGVTLRGGRHLTLDPPEHAR